MPSIIDNKEMFSAYDWNNEGHEWSSEWAGSNNLWHTEVYPRISAYLDRKDKNILEIACGYGRMSNYLLEYSASLTLVDINQNCIDFCKNKFSDKNNVKYIKNDGYLFDGVEDASMDFVFSYDSLVHVDCDVIESYLNEIKRVLKPDGFAFLHHSNLGSYTDLLDGGYINLGFRSTNVSHELVKKLSLNAGLTCVAQELIVWNCFIFTDAFVWLSNKEQALPYKFKTNMFFKDHSRYITDMAMLTNNYGYNGDLTTPTTMIEYINTLRIINKNNKLAVWGNSGKIYETTKALAGFGIEIDFSITENSQANYDESQISSIIDVGGKAFVILAFDILRDEWKIKLENAKNILRDIGVEFISTENIFKL